MTRTSFLFPALLALPGPLWAAEASLPAADGAYLVRLVAGLVLVLALLGALAWASRRFGLGRLAGASGGRLQVLASLSLGARERLLLVRVDGDELLLGVTQNGIRRLHRLPAASAAPDGFPRHLDEARQGPAEG